jgi:hypothetical protein
MNLGTGEVAPRLKYGDEDFDDDDIEAQVDLDMTKEQCEQFAMDLAKAVEGKWIHARFVVGYVNDDFFEVEGDFLVRICRPSCKGNILRWTTSYYIEPNWDFSVCYPWPALSPKDAYWAGIEPAPLSSPFTYGVIVCRVDQT